MEEEEEEEWSSAERRYLCCHMPFTFHEPEQAHSSIAHTYLLYADDVRNGWGLEARPMPCWRSYESAWEKGVWTPKWKDLKVYLVARMMGPVGPVTTISRQPK